VEIRNAWNILIGILEVRYESGNRDVVGRIILKWMLYN
jgi:hypothetical protein